MLERWKYWVTVALEVEVGDIDRTWFITYLIQRYMYTARLAHRSYMGHDFMMITSHAPRVVLIHLERRCARSSTSAAKARESFGRCPSTRALESHMIHL